MSLSDESSEFERERLQARDAIELELIRATTVFEHAAIRPLILLNGGAIVAILTFVGHLFSEISIASQSIDRQPLKNALLAWAFGLVAACVATSLGYFSQWNFLLEAQVLRRANEDRVRVRSLELDPTQRSNAVALGHRGDRCRYGAYVMGAVSVGLFLAGVVLAGQALRF